MIDYINEIKEILDSTEITGDFNTDKLFYMFQYPQHFLDYFGETTWTVFERTYLRNKIRNIMTIPYRYKYLIPNHIRGRKILELRTNIGVETYFIAKELKPASIISFEHSRPCIRLANLAFEMHKLDNVRSIEADLLNDVHVISDEFSDFDIAILPGHLCPFLFDTDEKYNYAREAFNNLFEFITNRTSGVFYFLAVDKFHVDLINNFFDDKQIVITNSTKVRPSKRYDRETESFKILEFDCDRKQDIFTGYVKL